jgi:hypothetical protein
VQDLVITSSLIGRVSSERAQFLSPGFTAFLFCRRSLRRRDSARIVLVTDAASQLDKGGDGVTAAAVARLPESDFANSERKAAESNADEIPMSLPTDCVIGQDRR